MAGLIKKIKAKTGFGPKKQSGKKERSSKRSPSSTRGRDYRGTRGAIDDADNGPSSR